MPEREVARDAPAHGQAYHVRFVSAELIEHPQKIGRERRKLERSFVVVGIAVAARVPRRRAIPGVKERELRRPVAAVAADAVQEDEELALADER